MNVSRLIWCTNYEITWMWIRDSINGIVYVDKKTLMWELSCSNVCNNVQQLTCNILNSFTDNNFKVSNWLKSVKSELQEKVEQDTQFIKEEKAKSLSKKSRSLYKNI